MSKVKSEHLHKILTDQEAETFYDYFVKNIKWEQGIKSKHGFTRLAKAIDIEDEPMVESLIQLVIHRIKDLSVNLKGKTSIGIFGVYLNYYKDGTHWTPNHSHKGTIQLVISLGADRIFNISKKSSTVSSGDVTIFGSSIHGIPKSETTKGRIGVAFFITY